jgi:hypothetical protein
MENEMFYEKCKDCDGAGYTLSFPVGKKQRQKITCLLCYGKGKFLTKTGEELLSFLKEESPWGNEIEYMKNDLEDKIRKLENYIDMK